MKNVGIHNQLERQEHTYRDNESIIKETIAFGSRLRAQGKIVKYMHSPVCIYEDRSVCAMVGDILSLDTEDNSKVFLIYTVDGNVLRYFVV